MVDLKPSYFSSKYLHSTHQTPRSHAVRQHHPISARTNIITPPVCGSFYFIFFFTPNESFYIYILLDAQRAHHFSGQQRATRASSVFAVYKQQPKPTEKSKKNIILCLPKKTSQLFRDINEVFMLEWTWLLLMLHALWPVLGA